MMEAFANRLLLSKADRVTTAHLHGLKYCSCSEKKVL